MTEGKMSRDMRWSDKTIWLCSNAYLPNTGGLVTYLRSSSKFLANGNARVHIFVTDSGLSSLNRNENVDGISIDRVAAFSFPVLLKMFTPFIATAKIYRQLKKKISSAGPPDHAVIRHIYYAAACSFLPSIRGQSIFIFPASAWKLEVINLRGKSIFEKTYRVCCALQLWVLEWFALKKIGRVAVLSASKKGELIKDWGIRRDIIVAPPGVAALIQDGEGGLRGELDERVSIAKLNHLILLVVCRLVEEKNVESLIRSIEHISHKVELWVVGDGPLRGRLTELAIASNLRVVFWGNRVHVKPFYERADLFVLPSKYEGFGHVLVEALANGCPVVGVKSDPPAVITATEEIILDGVNGFIASDPGPKAIAAAINRAIEEMPKIRATAADSVLNRFSWEAHFGALLGVADPVRD